MRGIDEHSLRLHQDPSGLVPESEGEVEEGILYCPLTTHVQELIDNLPETAGLEPSIPRFRLGLRSSKLCRLRLVRCKGVGIAYA
jgi:hypothetical protein